MDFAGATVGTFDMKRSDTVDALKEEICKAKGGDEFGPMVAAKDLCLFHANIEMKGRATLETFNRTVEHDHPKTTQVFAPHTVTIMLASQVKKSHDKDMRELERS